MERFRYLPHTADMEFRGYGKSFREALENSSLALLNVMLDLKKINKDRAAASSLIISEAADDEKELTWFVLQDILSKVDEKKLNAQKFKIISFKNDGKIRLKGKLIYKKTKENYALLSVKAVTPHDLLVKKGKGMVSINVVVDV